MLVGLWMSLSLMCLQPLPLIAQDAQPAASSQPASAPASQPKDTPGTLRKPEEAKMLEKLLDTAAPQPIVAQPSRRSKAKRTDVGLDGKILLEEGLVLVDRPARLVREGTRSRVVLAVVGDNQPTRTLDLTPNSLLEALETEAESGISDFVISGVVKRYRGTNYLELVKLVRGLPNGNLSP